MYNYETHPNLGYKFAAVRRIPCACNECIKRMMLPWDHTKGKQEQPRYSQNKDCVLWPFMEGENDWCIVEMDFDKKMGEEEFQEIADSVHVNYGEIIQDNIEINGFGVVAIEGDDDFEVVCYTSQPYRYKKATGYQQFMGHTECYLDELVVEAKTWKKVPRQTAWYSPTDIQVLVPLRKIALSKVSMTAISTENQLTNIRQYRTRDQLTLQQAKKLEEPKEAIMNAIEVMESFDYIKDNEILQVDDDDDDDDEAFVEDDEEHPFMDEM